jgi:uroporphyrinogen-III synthase
MSQFKILSTKKLDSSLIEQAKRNGIEIIEKEFIIITSILSKGKQEEVIGFCNKYLISVFTSANAVNTVKILNNAAKLDVCCLAGQTKEAVKQQFPSANILTEANNASDLAQKIIQSDIKEVVFFCGNKRREELPLALKEAEVEMHEVVVYETFDSPSEINEPLDAVLFFSPSAVKSFFL